MTRSRISMLVAAAGLILVGLLAAALFTPSDDEPAEATTPESEVAKVEPVQQTTLPNPLGYTLPTPQVQPQPVPAVQPVVQPEPRPEPAKPEAAGGVVEYKVASGDMISKIASRHGCKAEDIYALNPGLNAQTASKIRVGQVLKVPVGKDGAAAVEQARNGEGAPASAGDYFPRRVIKAEAGDTAMGLAVEHYGARHLFRMIMEANPDLPWADRLKGGEEVVLPEWGKAPASVVKEPKPAPAAVQRDSVIPPRK